MRLTLDAIEKKLQDSRLIRVNRSAMVNIDRMKELRYGDTYHYEALMDGGRSWNWGRKFPTTTCSASWLPEADFSFPRSPLLHLFSPKLHNPGK